MKLDTDTKVGLLKGVATGVAGVGVTYIVKEVLRNNTTIPDGKLGKIKLFIGTAVIVGMANQASDVFVEGKIDRGLERLRAVLDIMNGETDGGDEVAGEQSGS